LTRVGRIAWFWSTLNQALLDQARRLPEEATALQKLEELDFAGYRRLMQFLDAPANITPSAYADVRRKRPNASTIARGPREWSDRERTEFEAEVRDVAERLGYEWRTDKLSKEPRERARSPILDRAARLLRGAA
jgi:hypothetical protein